MNLPGTHAVQPRPSKPGTRRQSAMLSLPGGLSAFAKHGSQTAAPAWAWWVSAPHGKHSSVVAAAEEPSAQGAHCAVTSWMLVPAGHAAEQSGWLCPASQRHSPTCCPCLQCRRCPGRLRRAGLRSGLRVLVLAPVALHAESVSLVVSGVAPALLDSLVAADPSTLSGHAVQAALPCVPLNEPRVQGAHVLPSGPLWPLLHVQAVTCELATPTCACAGQVSQKPSTRTCWPRRPRTRCKEGRGIRDCTGSQWQRPSPRPSSCAPSRG